MVLAMTSKKKLDDVVINDYGMHWRVEWSSTMTSKNTLVVPCDALMTSIITVDEK